MDTRTELILVYLAPMVLIWVVYLVMRRRRHAAALRLLSDAYESGLSEPASLHPIIDPALCLGCATCVSACPEGDILGLVAGKAVLVQPASCIGHGACKEACPQDAIRLVLGTERRGVEVPVAGPDFETNVPGLFVAGEIGGMGLIRNAIAQGTQAMDAAAGRVRAASGKAGVDVVIVGAGPAGLAASLRARELGLRFVTLEQDTLGGTVAHYPRGKIVMTAPVQLPGYGAVKLRETSKEALLGLWTRVIEETGLRIDTGRRVRAVRRERDVLVVETEQEVYTASSVILCIGRRGTPRRLGVPGEDLDKVVYRLVDPEQYAGQHVLVVGGGDSAIEAALALAEQPGTHVTLSYRGQAFSRAKPANRDRLDRAVSAGRVDVLLEATPDAIGPRTVRLDTGVGAKELTNDAVIVCIGGLLPTPFLREAGIEIEVRHGE
jgi:thioredoxin reductase/ferredoxin